jgi:hypothetical protein
MRTTAEAPKCSCGSLLIRNYCTNANCSKSGAQVKVKTCGITEENLAMINDPDLAALLGDQDG